MTTDNPAKCDHNFEALYANEEPLDLSKRKHDKNIKQSLKSLIQTRRLAEGKELLSITFTKQEPAAPQLTEEELQKQVDRKEQNRRAAHKCRQKRKNKLEHFITEKEQLKTRKIWLESTLNELENEKDKLLQFLRTNSRNESQNQRFEEKPVTCIANNPSVINNSSCLQKQIMPHICCECEFLPKNQNHCYQKKFDKIIGVDVENCHQVSNKNMDLTDGKVSPLNYHIKTNPNSQGSSSNTHDMFEENKNSAYYSDNYDSDSSDDYLVIIESDSDSSEDYNNSQSSQSSVGTS